MRPYKRKSTRGCYGKEALDVAVDKVPKWRDEQPQGISHIWRFTENAKQTPWWTGEKPGSLGRLEPVLNSEHEGALVKHATEQQRMVFGLAPADIRKLAFQLANQKGLVHPFDNNKARKFWLQCFLKRNPQLSLSQQVWQEQLGSTDL